MYPRGFAWLYRMTRSSLEGIQPGDDKALPGRGRIREGFAIQLSKG